MATGISTAVKTNDDNWDRMNTFTRLGFKHIELYNKITRIRLADVSALRELKETQGISYSFHSMVQDLFCADEIIAMAELNCLKGEIRLASLIGCDYVIFHISKKTPLNDQELIDLNLLAKIAKGSGIKLCLENNFSNGVLSTEYLAEILGRVPDLWMCLDIGHLNVAINKGLIADRSNFLKQISNRVAQLHISFNDGKQDLHLGPASNDWKYFKEIIDELNNNNLLLVIETKNIDQAIEINKYLQNYV